MKTKKNVLTDNLFFIAHRGNVFGKEINLENSPDYIVRALEMGFDVEVDVWNKHGEWYLGHDNPDHRIDEKFLINDRLWCHAKDFQSLKKLSLLSGVNCFWHQSDDYTLTKNGFIWTYPGKQLCDLSSSVMPEEIDTQFKNIDHNVAGYCSDHIMKIKNLLT